MTRQLPVLPKATAPLAKEVENEKDAESKSKPLDDTDIDILKSYGLGGKLHSKRVKKICKIHSKRV